ncbi:amino acid ABC transporter permease [Campylobacter jejuni]|nr:amino acid ABC transporter permease [Campylobacter jejuni]EHN6903021.1 amino acid ABC transporter permease [Campylobacter jejuni]EHN6916888.1 amino acid ABC transporter permease [Campylobacter jejuni]
MFDFNYFIECFFLILPGIPITFFIAFLSFFLGCVIGLFFALIRIHNIFILSNLCTLFVSFFRGTPLLVQLVMFYNAIPQLMQMYELTFLNSIEPIYYALLAFTLYAIAYLTEIFRSALLAVDKGQIEAAYSVGMTYYQALIRIILPQAFMITLPNLLNFFIIQIKNTSLASIITVHDIMGLSEIELGRNSRYLEVYMMAALVYWFLCFSLENIFLYLETYFSKFRRVVFDRT